MNLVTIHAPHPQQPDSSKLIKLVLLSPVLREVTSFTLVKKFKKYVKINKKLTYENLKTSIFVII